MPIFPPISQSGNAPILPQGLREAPPGPAMGSGRFWGHQDGLCRAGIGTRGRCEWILPIFPPFSTHFPPRGCSRLSTGTRGGPTGAGDGVREVLGPGPAPTPAVPGLAWASSARPESPGAAPGTGFRWIWGGNHRPWNPWNRLLLPRAALFVPCHPPRGDLRGRCGGTSVPGH